MIWPPRPVVRLQEDAEARPCWWTAGTAAAQRNYIISGRPYTVGAAEWATLNLTVSWSDSERAYRASVTVWWTLGGWDQRKFRGLAGGFADTPPEAMDLAERLAVPHRPLYVTDPAGQTEVLRLSPWASA